MKVGRILRYILPLLALCATTKADSAQENAIAIGERIILRSEILDEERKLQISLPRGYRNSTDNYPVVYVLDGEGQFMQASGAIRFLGKVNRMPQAIVVGIPNTNRNRDLLPPTSNPQDLTRLPDAGRAEAFLAFLTNELRPYMEANYRTWPFHILFGHSGGGLFAVHTFLNAPTAFDAYIASSPSLWWNDHGEARSADTILAQNPERGGILFLSRGQETERMTTSIGKLVKVLQQGDWDNLEWKFKVFAEEDHESSSHRALYDGLAFIYEDWRFDFTYLYEAANPQRSTFTAEVLVEHYRRLSDRFGYNCRPREWYYNSVGYDLLRQEFVESAIEMFKANISFHPESPNVYDSLGEAYMKAGDNARAIEFYEKVLELDPGNSNAAAQLEVLRNWGR
jgi:predicted alpha/beta superfamily hydrolase